MAELNNPHDHFFREMLSRQETARDFLRHYLPPGVGSLLDLSSLEPLQESFIDQELREHSTDLLYQVALQKGGAPAYVYVLFEHKSYPDRLVALQLLRYMVRVWEHCVKQGLPLAPIMPVVLYHGAARWKVASNFQALFEVPAGLAPYLPEYHYWLCDLSQYSDEAIKGAMTLRVGLLVLKYILRDDLREHLADILDLLGQLSQQQTGLEYLETVLRYLAGGTDKITKEELWDALEAAFPEGSRTMSTPAEQWRQEGLQQGLQQGRQEGEQIGLKKGEQTGLKKGARQTTLKNLRQILTIRFDAPPPDFERRLEPLDLPTLEQLITAGLTLPTMAEFEQAVAKLGSAENKEPCL
jgi:predicted transposase/invertase (TIGR01784 family)